MYINNELYDDIKSLNTVIKKKGVTKYLTGD